MLFNSLDFALFLPLVFSIYWLCGNKNIRLQNIVIVISSYIFYGCWDWRFLFLILISTIVDFFIGYGLSKAKNIQTRKLLLYGSLLVNLGFLGFFKYYNFFVENFITAFSFFGVDFTANTLNIILPVGISFYTFQTLSYTIDVYRKKLEPTYDFIAFMAYVSFFPQLVAGPIERATNLLPQFGKKRYFDKDLALDGFQQILWGLFKKMVVADNCAEIANQIFNNSSDYSGLTLVLGAFFFAFQIYGDFSGYSDIAIGLARLFGFNLKKNFAYPYFSRDIAEFWRRWHISLSTWFRDYVYIPLGGSRGGTAMKIRNTFIIFLVSGFWHGANFTFIVWGALNALYFLPLLLSNKNRQNIDIVAKGKTLPDIRDLFNIVTTFSITVFAWIFFRANSISHAKTYIQDIFTYSFFKYPPEVYNNLLYKTLFILFIFNILEWLGREKEYAFQIVSNQPKYIKALYFSLLIVFMLLFMSLSVQEFIYFQF